MKIAGYCKYILRIQLGSGFARSSEPSVCHSVFGGSSCYHAYHNHQPFPGIINVHFRVVINASSAFFLWLVHVTGILNYAR